MPVRISFELKSDRWISTKARVRDFIRPRISKACGRVPYKKNHLKGLFWVVSVNDLCLKKKKDFFRTMRLLLAIGAACVSLLSVQSDQSDFNHVNQDGSFSFG